MNFWSYAGSIIGGWFGIVLLILGIVELVRWLVRWFFPKRTHTLEYILESSKKWRWYVLLIVLSLAQGQAYYELSRKPVAAQNEKSLKVEVSESPNVDLLAKLSEKTDKVAGLQGEIEKLKASLKDKDNEISKLRSTTRPVTKQPSNSRVEQPRRLSEVRCAEFAELIKKGNAALERLEKEDFSEQSRQNASGLTNEIKTWLDTNLGPVQSQAFLAAPPWSQGFAGMSFQYGGIYQTLRGRLTYLTTLADRQCS